MDFVGLDKLSLLDYPNKIACVLFTNHCNFACPYCHNALSIINSEQYIPFNEIMSYLTLRKKVLDGVVITGGEPTLMPDLKEKIIEIRKLGLSIKLDTNGTNPQILKNLIEEGIINFVDLYIKNGPSGYLMTAGINNPSLLENVLESVKILKEGKIDYEFRTTLVSEYHSLKDIKEIGELIKGSKRLYLQKFVERETCLKKGLHEVSEDLARSYQKELSNYIEAVELRGY